MKRISLIALAAGLAFCASAQQNVVKEAERALKAGRSYNDVLNIINPALTNPETAESSDTWMIPGKAAFDQYDKQVANKQLHMFKEPKDTINHDMLLLPAYEHYMKALSVDTVYDKKGKPKAKNSGKIINALAGHLNDYYNAGAELYNYKKFDDAYKAFGVFITLCQRPEFKKAISNNPMANDSVVSNTAFNQGICAWQTENFENALEAFIKAKNLGYNKKQVYDFALAVAQSAGKNDTLFALAQEALPLYGKEDSQYIRQIANHFLQTKEFDKAFWAINKAIEDDPGNAQYYVVKGVISEFSGDLENGIKSYAEAYKIDDKNAEAAYNYGRSLCEKAFKLGDSAPTTQAEYEIFLNEKIKPLFNQAIPLLEAAYNLDPDNSDVLKYLENAYYNLGDTKMYDDVQNRKKYQ